MVGMIVGEEEDSGCLAWTSILMEARKVGVAAGWDDDVSAAGICFKLHII